MLATWGELAVWFFRSGGWLSSWAACWDVWQGLPTCHGGGWSTGVGGSWAWSSGTNRSLEEKKNEGRGFEKLGVLGTERQESKWILLLSLEEL